MVGHDKKVANIAWHPSVGLCLASADFGGMIKIWDV